MRLSAPSTPGQNATMRRKRHRLRAAFWAATTLLLGAYAALHYATRPAALQMRIGELFRRFGLHVVREGDAAFSLWSGLRVRDLSVAPPRSPAGGELDDDTPLLHIPDATVSFDGWALLTGRLTPREIVLRGPEITLRRPAAGNRIGWRIPYEPGVARSGWTTAVLPGVRIEAGDVRLVTGEPGARRLARRWIVDGEGRLFGGDGSAPAEYRLLLRQTAGSATTSRAAVATLTWRPGELRVSLSPLDLDTIDAIAPREWVEWRRRLSLSGTIWLNEFVQNASGTQVADVGFSDAQFDLPLGEPGAVPDPESYARVRQASGRIVASSLSGRLVRSEGFRGDVALQLDGEMAGGSAHVSYWARGLESSSDWVPDRKEDATIPVRAESHVARILLTGCRFPQRGRNDSFMNSEALPPAIRAFFVDYEPSGQFNLELRSVAGASDPDESPPSWLTLPDDVAARPGVSGVFKPVNGVCRYFRFPYRISDVSGEVHFDDRGIELRGLTGRHGTCVVHGEGRVNRPDDATGFDLTFRAENVALEEALYAALPPHHQRLWRSADPTGLANAIIRVRREEGDDAGPCPTDIEVDARLWAGSLSLPPDRRVTGADGRIRIANDVLTIDELHGYLTESAVRVRGVVRPPPDDQREPIVDLRVEAQAMRLVRHGTVHDAGGAPLGAVSFAGIGDVAGTVRSLDDRTTERYAVDVLDGELRGFDGSAWTAMRGRVSLDGETLRLHHLASRNETEHISLRGVLPRDNPGARPIELELSARDSDMARLLRRLSPSRWAALRDGLAVGGGGTIAAVFRAEPDETGSESSVQFIDVRLAADRLKPTVVPVDLTDVTAYATIRGNGFTLHKADARIAPQGSLSVTGACTWDAADERLDLRADVREFHVTPERVDALPSALARLLKRMAFLGVVDATLDSVRMDSRAQDRWSFEGELRFRDAAMRVGLALEDAAGSLRGTCRMAPDNRVELAADFTIEHGRLARRPVREWHGRLSYRSDDGWIRLDDVRGYLCGGQMVGTARIEPDTGEYEISMTLDDVSLDAFLRDSATPANASRDGLVDGRVFVRGRGDDPAMRIGGGELRIVGASLLSSSVTAGLFDAARTRNSTLADRVSTADVRFVWEGNEVKFNRVDIRTSDQRLVGRGAWNMRTDTVSLEMVGAPPEDAPRLAVVSDLLELASHELVQYRIDGPASSPRVKIEPLHNLTDPVRRLLRGEP